MPRIWILHHNIAAAHTAVSAKEHLTRNNVVQGMKSKIFISTEII